MEVYGIEHGDVLLSLQLILTNEEELAGRRPQGPPPAMAVVKAPPTSRSALSLAPMPPAPSKHVVMVDPDTGAGTLQALRRDLALQREASAGSAPAVVALDFQALDQIRLVLGDRSAEDVVKGLVEVAPFALRTRDRVYRSGRDQLTLVLPGADDDVVEASRGELELALGRFLTDRGFPEVRLSARRVDPASLAG